MVKGIFGSLFAFTEMLTRATPLIFTGLAATLAFRAKLWNIGAEGQFYLGAMAAVAVGTGWIDGPAILLIPMILIAGALAGALGMAGPAYLKTRFGADEVVTTLLLNFIILIFVQMMLEGPLKDPMGMGWPQSSPMLNNAVLPQLLSRMRLHSGLIIALVLAVLAHIMLSTSVWGFKLRAVGENAAAMLAGLSPLGVVLAALFIASVFVGADTMSHAMGVSSYLADLVVSLSLLCVLIGGFIARFKITFTPSHKKPPAPVATTSSDTGAG